MEHKKRNLFIIGCIVAALLVIVITTVIIVVIKKNKQQTNNNEEKLFNTPEYKHVAELAKDLTDSDTAYIVDASAQLASAISQIRALENISEADKLTLNNLYDTIMGDDLVELKEIKNMQETVNSILSKYSNDPTLTKELNNIKIYTNAVTKEYINSITDLIARCNAYKYITPEEYESLKKEASELEPEEFNDFKQKLQNIIDEHQSTKDQLKDIQFEQEELKNASYELDEAVSATIDKLLELEVLNAEESRQLRYELENEMTSGSNEMLKMILEINDNLEQAMKEGNEETIKKLQNQLNETMIKENKETMTKINTLKKQIEDERKKGNDEVVNTLTTQLNNAMKSINKETLDIVLKLQDDLEKAMIEEDNALAESIQKQINDELSKENKENLKRVTELRDEMNKAITEGNNELATVLKNKYDKEFGVVSSNAKIVAEKVKELAQQQNIETSRLDKALEDFQDEQDSLNSSLIAMLEVLSSVLVDDDKREQIQQKFNKISEDNVITNKELAELKNLLYDGGFSKEIAKIEEAQNKYTSEMNKTKNNVLNKLKKLLSDFSNDAEKKKKINNLIYKIESSNTVGIDDVDEINSLVLDDNMAKISNELSELQNNYMINTKSLTNKIESIILSIRAAYLGIPEEKANNLTTEQIKTMNTLEGYSELLQKWEGMKSKNKGSVSPQEYQEFQLSLNALLNISNLEASSRKADALNNTLTSKIQGLNTRINTLESNTNILSKIILPEGVSINNVNTKYYGTLGQFADIAKNINADSKTKDLTNYAMKKLYPVNSIMIRYDEINPKDLPGLEGTSWEKLPDNYLLTTGQKYSLTNGNLSSTSAHTLTASQIPSHSHYFSGSVGSGGSHSHSFSGTTSTSGASHTHSYRDTVHNEIDSTGQTLGGLNKEYHSTANIGSHSTDSDNKYYMYLNRTTDSSSASHYHSFSGSVGSGGSHSHSFSGTITATGGNGSHSHSLNLPRVSVSVWRRTV